MKISRNSWHYKLNRKLGIGNPPDNICKYFWTTVGFSLLAVVGVAFGLWITVVGPLLGIYAILGGAPEAVIVSGLIIPGLIWGLFGYAYLTEERNVSVNVAPEGTFRRVAFEKARAAKNRVCPRIEFVED